MAKGIGLIGIGISLIILIYYIVGYIVQYLYNYVVVDSMHWHDVYMSMPAAIGLVILCSVLFKSSSSSKG